MKFSPNPTWKWILVLSCLLLGLTFRLANFPYFTYPFIEGHFNFIDPDCYYHLRRLVSFLENFPAIPHFDPLADWPFGSNVDWGPGFLLLLGIPLKILSVSQFANLEVTSSVLMILLGLVTCWTIYRAGSKVLPVPRMQMILLLVAVSNYFLIRYSCLGEVDHHILEALFPPLLFWITCSIIENEERAWREWALAGLLIVYGLSVSSSTLFLVCAWLFTFVFVWGNRAHIKYALFNMLIPCSLILIGMSAWNHTFTHSWFSVDHVSFFQSFLFLGSILLALIAIRFSLAIRASLVATASCGIFIIIALDLFPSWSTGFLAGINYLVGEGLISHVAEAQPLFIEQGGFSLSFAINHFGYCFPLLILPALLLLRSKNLTREERTLFLMLTLLSIPGFFQKRFSPVMVGLYLIFAVWCLSRIQLHSAEKKWGLGIPLLLLFIASMIIPTAEMGFAPHGKTRDLADFRIAKTFVRTVEAQGLSPKIVWDRLSGKTTVSEGVWANPNLGHLIEYLTGMGVVTNAFYHASGLNLDYQLRKIESDPEFSRVLRKSKIRYTLLTDDYAFFDMQEKIRGSKLTHPERYAWVRAVRSGIPQENPSMRQVFAEELSRDYPLYHFVRGLEVASIRRASAK